MLHMFFLFLQDKGDDCLIILLNRYFLSEKIIKNKDIPDYCLCVSVLHPQFHEHLEVLIIDKLSDLFQVTLLIFCILVFQFPILSVLVTVVIKLTSG